jgi:hypothetical protein
MPILALIVFPLVITTLVTLHLLIADINKTSIVLHVPHQGHYTFGQIKEIKRLHQELLPNSGRFKFFRVLEILCYTLSAIFIVVLVMFLIEIKTKAPY